MSSSRVPVVGESALPVFGVSIPEVLKRRPNPGGVPLFIQDIISFLETQSDPDSLFRVAGSASQVQKLKSLYDSDITIKLSGMDPYVVAGLLKLFFRELPEAIMTYDCYSYFLDAIGIRSETERLHAIKDLIETLPIENQRILKLVIGFLYRISKKTTKIPHTISGLATVFGPILLRPRQQSMSQMVADGPMVNKIIANMIENFGFIFSVRDVASPLDRKRESAESQRESTRSTTPTNGTTNGSRPQSTEQTYQTPSEKKVPSKLIVDQSAQKPGSPSLPSSPHNATIQAIIKQMVHQFITLEEPYNLQRFSMGAPIGGTISYAPKRSSRVTRTQEGISTATSIRSGESSARSSISSASQEPRMSRTTPEPRSAIVTPEDDISDPEDIQRASNPLELANKNLASERRKANRPIELSKMNPEQLREEKSAIKRELRDYDVAFLKKTGREVHLLQTLYERQNGDPQKNDKEIMRPLYQRYKEVKQLVDGGTQQLEPQLNDDVAPAAPVTTPPNPVANELEANETYKKLKAEKRTLQVKLHNYQDEFYKKNGRKVKFVVDQPIKEEYIRYKNLKARIQAMEDEFAATGRISSSANSVRANSAGSADSAPMRSTY